MRFAACLLLVSVSLFGQEPSSAPPALPAGHVTGRVMCADTGQPARFAGVQLVAEQPAAFSPVEAAGAPSKPDSGLQGSAAGSSPDFATALAKAMTALMKGSGLSTLTALDGSFVLDRVPPGAYYVLAQLPGYQSSVSQFSVAERLKADPAMVAALKASAPKIVVEAGGSAQIDIRLERGAALSGTVQYDDGSPATGVSPVLLALQDDGKWKEIQLPPAGGAPAGVTNDRGRYRIFGLSAGQYAVRAALPTSQAVIGVGAGSLAVHLNTGDSFVAYSGGAQRQSELKPIKLASGEERDGVDLVFPISGLHSISGHVVAKADGHAVDGGLVELWYVGDNEKSRSAIVEPDGAFHLNYVPEGKYLLKVVGAGDLEEHSAAPESDFTRLLNSKTTKSYGPTELSLILQSDAVGVVLEVPELPGKPSEGGK